MADGRVTVEAVVRGYHAYKHIWAAVYGEELPCEREAGNRVDAFAVAVMKDGTVVGHVPKKISSICSLYLRRGGSIICRVTGSRRYSEDLIQGGLEIPCVLIFEGGATLTTKAKKLVVSALLGVASGMYKISGVQIFAVFIFAFRSWVVKIAKIWTLRKFPAIRYIYVYDHSRTTGLHTCLPPA